MLKIGQKVKGGDFEGTIVRIGIEKGAHLYYVQTGHKIVHKFRESELKLVQEVEIKTKRKYNKKNNENDNKSIDNPIKLG